jgi:hypothetical protein
MKDRDTNRALQGAYTHSIARFEKLLKTHMTDVDRNYIKERISACEAAILALDRPESRTCARAIGTVELR